MILRSGKYKGYSVREAWAKDPSYIRWVAENVPAMLKSHSSPTKSTATKKPYVYIDPPEVSDKERGVIRPMSPNEAFDLE